MQNAVFWDVEPCEFSKTPNVLECVASFFRVEKSDRDVLLLRLSLLATVNVFLSSRIFSTLKME
jgi:hypothetical protein